MDHYSVITIIFGVIIGMAVLIIPIIFFSISLYKALKRIPEEKLEFPAWFVWMFLVPVAGYVFLWMMLPFGIPRSFRKAVQNNPEAENRASTLFGLGLTFCILILVSFTPFLAAILGLPTLIILIIYWVKIVQFRRLYLDSL